MGYFNTGLRVEYNRGPRVLINLGWSVPSHVRVSQLKNIKGYWWAPRILQQHFQTFPAKQ